MRSDFELTPAESELVQNSDWILTKHRIIEKVYALFGSINETFKKELSFFAAQIPDEVNAVSPKIYKGEQYRQLPYVMLDHPRYFKKADTFAIRSFFWWGNGFSIHLVLGGKYKRLYQEKIIQQIDNGSMDQWSLGVSGDPWQHHFEADNYLPLKDFTDAGDHIRKNDFLKIGRSHPLQQWREAETFFTGSYHEILQNICGDQTTASQQRL
jgi:hypothetical protein